MSADKKAHKYLTGVSALKNKLSQAFMEMPDEWDENKYDLVVLMMFTKNKYDEGFVDVKIKNIYVETHDGLKAFEYKIKGTIYKCLKLRKDMPYAAARFTREQVLKLDEDLTSMIKCKQITGQYGDFTVLYIETEYTDYEEF